MFLKSYDSFRQLGCYGLGGGPGRIKAVQFCVWLTDVNSKETDLTQLLSFIISHTIRYKLINICIEDF